MQVRRYLPFSGGNRACVGMELARLNYTVALALLLSHFSFRLADEACLSCLRRAAASVLLQSMRMANVMQSPMVT